MIGRVSPPTPPLNPSTHIHLYTASLSVSQFVSPNRLRCTIFPISPCLPLTQSHAAAHFDRFAPPKALAAYDLGGRVEPHHALLMLVPDVARLAYGEAAR